MLILVALITALCIQPVFADDDMSFSEAKAQFQETVNKTYGILRIVALGGGALALAGCGLIMMYGSNKDGEKAKATIKYILIAVAGIWILPAVIRLGKTMFGTAWDPHSIG